MMVGTTGIDRVVERTAMLMREHDTDDAGEIAGHGAIPLDVIQKYLNFHYSVSLDLFGGETSTNVANYYTAGLKGRWLEDRRKDDHRLTDDAMLVDAVARRRDRADRGLRARRPQHRPAPRVHLRLPGRREALEQDPRRARPVAAAGAAARRVQPPGRRVRGHRGHPRRAPAQRRRVGARAGQVPADRGRQDPRPLADAPGVRAREDRLVDRARRATGSTASRSTTTTSTCRECRRVQRLRVPARSSGGRRRRRPAGAHRRRPATSPTPSCTSGCAAPRPGCAGSGCNPSSACSCSWPTRPSSSSSTWPRCAWAPSRSRCRR